MVDSKFGGPRRLDKPVRQPADRPSAPKTSAPKTSAPKKAKVWRAVGSNRRAGPGGVAPQRASAPKTAFDGPAFESDLDRATNSRARTGNRATVLFDGVESFAARKELIASARETINLQTFIFHSDEAGWELANQLSAKARDGVNVRVIYDAVGSNRADKAMFEMMKQAGVEVRPYGNVLTQFWDLNDRWHEKHLIVDGRTSIEGGMNIANEYALGGSGKLVFSRGNKVGDEPWRDVDVKVEGPAVNDAQAAFLRNWKELGPDVSEAERARLMPPLPLKPQQVSVRVVQHRPDEEGDENVARLYLKAIATARTSVTIENEIPSSSKAAEMRLMDVNEVAFATTAAVQQLRRIDEYGGNKAKGVKPNRADGVVTDGEIANYGRTGGRLQLEARPLAQLVKASR